MGRVVASDASGPDGDFAGSGARVGRAADFAGFRAIGIVGLGLIGGSLALAIRERWPQTTIVGVDRPDVVAEALARGVISAGATRAGALAERLLDLIVLAAPVLQNIACLHEIAGATAASAAPPSGAAVSIAGLEAPAGTQPARSPLLITDVGSTKLSIVTAARDEAIARPGLTFIGGHPIAGAAHGGLAHARVDLFRDRPWLFTPHDDASDAESEALGLLFAFVRALGAQPALLQADEHDRVMAYVSHLPQLAASSLMRVAGEGAGDAGLALSGAGLADTTRLASSPSSMWTEILRSNAGHVRLALDAFIADLQAVRDQLTSPAAAAWLDAGAMWRARLGNGNDTRID
jgi:prephenate dehydrogenase